jgi:hypothetical protein
MSIIETPTSLSAALATQTPAELEQRRREIVTAFTTKYRGYDDPDIPLELLHELAFITQTLRRKNAGPPKAKKTAAAKPTIEDL